jgi:hypothetical protein
MNRRNFLCTAAATAGLALATPVFGKKTGVARLSHKERVDRALRGQDLDRPPFTFYHHYKRPTAKLEAQDHLEFHRNYNTNIVKVMNDFDYPQSATGKWYELKPLDSPFPEQLATLKLVRDGLRYEWVERNPIKPYAKARSGSEFQTFSSLPKFNCCLAS